ncbi:MAG: FkbM family methyltransferase [Bacteroidota bacterium]
MNNLQRVWQKVAPNRLLVLIRFILEPKSYKVRRKAVLEYYKSLDPKLISPEMQEGLTYLKHHKYSAFPYKWTQKYDNFLPDVFRDEQLQRFYILFEGKKMYFPKKFTKSHVIWAARSMYKEQDKYSPHLYLTSDFQVEAGSIIIDAGVAEGNFSLSVVEKAKRLYLIECEAEWMDTLRLTFEPWKDKVVFVEKFMSDAAGETTTSIDALLHPFNNEKFFIKLDIEGSEQKALAGMKNLVASGNPVKINVCTYHQPNAFDEIQKILKDYGFLWEVSEGYVLFFHPGEKPAFRRNLVRASKS